MTVLAYTVTREGPTWSADWAEQPDARVAAGVAVVEVTAAALAWSDVLQTQGRYAGVVPDPPFIGGHEFAGVVADVAADAEFQPADRVFGFLPSPGAFCEYLAAPVAYLHRTPEDVNDLAAAALTTSFLTADAGLVVFGGMAPQSTVLIHAGAGGVGRAAIQLARAYGVGTLIATAGSAARRADTVALGADVCAGYDDFAQVVLDHTDGRGVDVVLESVGGDVFDASARILAPAGRLVTIGASSGRPPTRLKLPLLWQRSISVCGLHLGRLLREAPELLRPSWSRILPLLAAGVVDPGVGLVVAPADIETGMTALTSRTVAGRVVIDFTRGITRAGQGRASTPSPQRRGGSAP